MALLANLQLALSSDHAPKDVVKKFQEMRYTFFRCFLMLGSLYSIFATAFDVGFLEDSPVWMPWANFIATVLISTDFVIRWKIASRLSQTPAHSAKLWWWIYISPGLLLLYGIDLALSMLGCCMFLIHLAIPMYAPSMLALIHLAIPTFDLCRLGSCIFPPGWYGFTLRFVFFIISLIRIVFIADLFRSLFSLHRGRIVRVIRFVIYELYWCHLVACLFFFIAKKTPPEMGSWIRRMHGDLRDVGVGELYITSMYFAATTIFHVGYGEIHPDNPMEMCASVFVIIVTTVILTNLRGGFEPGRGGADDDPGAAAAHGDPGAPAAHGDPGEVADQTS